MKYDRTTTAVRQQDLSILRVTRIKCSLQDVRYRKESHGQASRPKACAIRSGLREDTSQYSLGRFCCADSNNKSGTLRPHVSIIVSQSRDLEYFNTLLALQVAGCPPPRPTEAEVCALATCSVSTELGIHKFGRRRRRLSAQAYFISRCSVENRRRLLS